MAMTDEEIRSAAARLNAAKRRQVKKTCEVCGTDFVGIAVRRYCSDRCRVEAARQRQENSRSTGVTNHVSTMEHGEVPAPRGEDESIVDYLGRVRAYLSKGRVFDDSTEIVRQSRIERTEQLMQAVES